MAVDLKAESCIRNVSLAWQVAIATRRNVTDVRDVDANVVGELERETEMLRTEAYGLNIKVSSTTLVGIFGIMLRITHWW